MTSSIPSSLSSFSSKTIFLLLLIVSVIYLQQSLQIAVNNSQNTVLEGIPPIQSHLLPIDSANKTQDFLGHSTQTVTAAATTTTSGESHHQTILRRSNSPPKPEELGRWIGNTWIPPPGWQYYAPEELLELYKNIKIWWLGDSMGRRAGLTFYYILNSTKRHRQHYHSKNPTREQLDEDRVINLNKKTLEENCTLFQDNVTRYPPSVCRPMPHHNGEGYFMQTAGPCALDMALFLQEQVQNLTTNVDQFHVLVIFVGAWENFRQDACREGGGGNPGALLLNRTNDRLNRYLTLVDACHRFTRVYPKVHIVWRTQGFARTGTMPLKFPKIATGESRQIMERIDALGNDQVSYIDWGAAVYERSFGSERIEGDSIWHYGVEPRVVLIQMLTNHLLDRGALSLASLELPNHKP